jgi:NAD(P)-dependent dehydrogenase (short-subunit alcohol dehydrogenase family)
MNTDTVNTSAPAAPAQTNPSIRLDGQVAIVTGAGGGLGRAHALELARRGAKVLVNDLGVSVNGASAPASGAQQVVADIRAQGGEAFASTASVTDDEAVARMVGETMRRWGRVDILINNAGFLRDKSFSKMTMDEFMAIVDVHLLGAVRCTKAVWDIMKAQGYGRVVMTTSSSGLYGNFGQANYGAAKMALVGLMQTLAIEGRKYDIRVNCLAPSAATRMTEQLFSAEQLALLTPESVSPGLIYLVSPDAPSKTILCAGAGAFARANVTLGGGVYVGNGPLAAETLAMHAHQLADRSQETVPLDGLQQSRQEVALALPRA